MTASAVSRYLLMYRRTILAALAGVSVGAVAGGDTDAIHAESTTATENPPVPNDESVEEVGDDEPAESAVEFELAPFELSSCGTACRDVTATVTNAGSADATDVRVFVTVIAEETPVWETEEPVGRLAAGESVTRTHRIEVDLGTALTLRDETVTIETLIESAQRTDRIVREEALS